MDKKWYVVRTYSGHENKVKAYIENEIAQAGLSDKVTSGDRPVGKGVRGEGRKEEEQDAHVLSRATSSSRRSWTRPTTHLILNTPSVISFVGPKNAPAPLQASEIRRLIGKIEERKDVEVIEVPFKSGDAVKVTDGPFNNFSGFVQEVNEEKMKLKVMVSIFGRKTPVELDFSQVELEK